VKTPSFIKTYWFIYIVLLALIEPLTWFSLGNRLSGLGAIANVLLIIVPAGIAAGVILMIRFLRKKPPQLTEQTPIDTASNKRRWSNLSQKCEFTSLLGEREATML